MEGADIIIQICRIPSYHVFDQVHALHYRTSHASSLPQAALSSPSIEIDQSTGRILDRGDDSSAGTGRIALPDGSSRHQPSGSGALHHWNTGTWEGRIRRTVNRLQGRSMCSFAPRIHPWRSKGNIPLTLETTSYNFEYLQ